MIERRVIAVEGIVQGVGFRPYVHRLATALRLTGRVRNAGAGVLVEVEGEPATLDNFLTRLSEAPPPPAIIHSITSEFRFHPAGPAAQSCAGFVIAASNSGESSHALLSADLATCGACEGELFDPANRRYRYPFISCSSCGPRLTIVTAMPYDRPRTTMESFTLCDDCAREYQDPGDRRFHAQPIACAACGPALMLRARHAGSAEWLPVFQPGTSAALDATLAVLDGGGIAAVKGLGGYHLACDAANAAAVGRLRARKHREAKPLAVMVRDLNSASALCSVSPGEAELMASAARPIVLLDIRSDLATETRTALAALAPGLGQLGVMLPYTPLHHLLLDAADRALVMTSGNQTGEPIAAADDDAFERLRDVADLFLLHDRPIAMRCDDSVMRITGRGGAFLRRARGFAPEPLALARAVATPVLAVGGHLKNTFCLADGHRAFVSQHIGDLDGPASYRALAEAVAHYERLFDVRPQIIAHDLHPDYLSTRYAREGYPDLAHVAVQHHHAHVASCLAEHGVTTTVIGVAFDGAGLGTDGAIWGGEFLLADCTRYERLAHLSYVPLPGGDAAAREPWRMAASHLWSTYGRDAEHLPIVFPPAILGGRWPLLRRMLERGVNSPPTSSVGRLFDAVASLVGVRHLAAFEAQAAAELEALADRSETRTYPVELREADGGLIVETAPLIRGVVDDLAAGRSGSLIAGVFHNALRDIVVATCNRIRADTGVATVALTGGVFQNALLTDRTCAALAAGGFDVLVHNRVPCNDGGLSLGQAVIAGNCRMAGGVLCA